MHVRLLAVLLLAASLVAGCSVALRLSETGISIEWPKLPDLGIPTF